MNTIVPYQLEETKLTTYLATKNKRYEELQFLYIRYWHLNNAFLGLIQSSSTIL